MKHLEIVKSAKIKSKEVQITKRKRCLFQYCCFKNIIKKNVEVKFEYELLDAAEEFVTERMEIIELMKNLDQFRFLGRLILSKNQFFYASE